MEVKRGRCGWTAIGKGWRVTCKGSHVDCMVVDGLYLTWAIWNGIFKYTRCPNYCRS
jgi:hypothetical protein